MSLEVWTLNGAISVTLSTCNVISSEVKKAYIRNRYNQVPHLTRDTTLESDKTQESITHKIVRRSALSQRVVTGLQGTEKTV